MDDDFYGAESTREREQRWRKDLLDRQHSWDMLDDQHIAPPTDSPEHYAQWMANSERKRQQSIATSGSNNEAAGFDILLAPFLLILILVAPLLLALFWHYRKRNWLYLGVTALLFVAPAAYAVSKSHGDIWNTLFAVELAFTAIYFPIAAIGWVCHRLNDRIAQGAPFKLGVWPALVLLSLAIAFETLFFLWISGLGWGVSLVRFTAGSVGYLGGRTYLNLSDYSNVATLILAAGPNFIILSALQAWFRNRRERGKRVVPWLFYLPVAWVVGLALFLGVVITMNHLTRNEQVVAIAPRGTVAQEMGRQTTPSSKRCPLHRKHC